MGLEGLVWVIPVLVIGNCAFVGCLFAVVGWAKVALDSRELSGKRAPRSLVAFTASVITNICVIGFLVIFDEVASLRFTIEEDVQRIAIVFGLLTSVALFVVAFRDTREDTSSPSGIVKTGSVVLLILQGAGLALFLLAGIWR